MTAPTPSIGMRLEPPAPASIVFVGGPRDGREEVVDVPGGLPTIIAVDEAVGYYVRDAQEPDGRWRLVWRGFE